MVGTAVRMSASDNTGSTQLKELMGRVFESAACEAFGDFVTRRIALGDLAPMSDDALLDGIDESPDGGAAMAEAHLVSLPEEAREALLERAALETGRRLHAAAVTLLAAVDAAAARGDHARDGRRRRRDRAGRHRAVRGALRLMRRVVDLFPGGLRRQTPPRTVYVGSHEDKLSRLPSDAHRPRRRRPYTRGRRAPDGRAPWPEIPAFIRGPWATPWKAAGRSTDNRAGGTTQGKMG